MDVQHILDATDKVLLITVILFNAAVVVASLYYLKVSEQTDPRWRAMKIWYAITGLLMVITNTIFLVQNLVPFVGMAGGLVWAPTILGSVLVSISRLREEKTITEINKDANASLAGE